MYGKDGNDTLRGGAGTGDYLSGDAGNDTYLFGRNFGSDTVSNYDADSSSVDVIRFEDIPLTELWFSKSRDHLLITVAGTDDRVTVSKWFSSDDYQLERIEAGSSVMLNNQIDQLVSAMASYNVPVGVGSIIPAAVRDDLSIVLVQSWQSIQ